MSGPKRPERIGICGIGQMGSACAVAFRRSGFDVLIYGRDPEKLHTLDTTLKSLDRWCDQNQGAKDQETTPDASQPTLGQLEKTDRLQDLDEQCDVILDCIIEVLDDKVDLLSKFPGAAQRGALFLSATSALPITEMAARSGLDELLVGAHFWNPPHIVPVVEMIRGKKTPEHRLKQACELMESIGKIPIPCKDVPGFVGNRLLHAMWREALFMLEEDVCSPQDLDRITKWTFALRLPVLGPIENMDYVGLDATERLQRYMAPHLANHLEPPKCLTEKLDRGELGIKSGKGFYDWTQRDAENMLAKRDLQVLQQLAFLKEIGEMP